jgi:excisionase family DNA binding protein
VARTLSTEEVADLVEVHRLTLQRWISDGKVSASIAIPMKGRTLWRWTAADVKRVKKFKTTNYRKKTAKS